MTTGGNGNAMLLKIGVGVISTLLTAAIIFIAANLAQLNRDIITLQAWRNQLDAADSALRNSLPRNEWNLEKAFLYAEVEQLRSRVIAIEQRERP